jgi:hypothetical protein
LVEAVLELGERPAFFPGDEEGGSEELQDFGDDDGGAVFGWMCVCMCMCVYRCMRGLGDRVDAYVYA